MHAISDITGGGIAANIARVLPEGTHADVDRATWACAGVPAHLRPGRRHPGRAGAHVQRRLGMVCVVSDTAAAATVDRLIARGIPAWVCGSVRAARPDDVTDAPCQGRLGGLCDSRRDACELTVAGAARLLSATTHPAPHTSAQAGGLSEESSSSPSSRYFAYGSSSNSSSSSESTDSTGLPTSRPEGAQGPWRDPRTSTAWRPSSAWPWLGRAPWLAPSSGTSPVIPGPPAWTRVTPARGAIAFILPTPHDRCAPF